jgi:2',3'-cyclic-nucleotide 2'-phosphodiesterase
MKYNKKLSLYLILLIIVLITIIALPKLFDSGSYHKLYIMNTTDEHQYIFPYNYMEDKIDENIGISKIYSLVEEIRNQSDNTLLLSAGDIIQGSLIGELEAKVNPLSGNEFQTIIKVFNYMGYEAAAIGNHDLSDFGIDFFERARRNANFPWLSANIKKAANPEEYFTEPYIILDKKVDGIPIKIGIIGFTPPQIMLWGRSLLEGKIIAENIIPKAEKYIPILKEKSDIIIALAHSGIDASDMTSKSSSENAGYYLAQIEGIDAVILGHRHDVFPGNFDGIENIDEEKGLIFGTPTTLARSWGRALGVIEFDLLYKNGNWKIINGSSYLKPVNETVRSHPEIENIARDIHEKTLKYLRTPIGKTQSIISSYFSRVVDSPLLQLINNAQLWHAKKIIAGTKYENMPLISTSAAFIAGREGPHYFTYVDIGDINIGDVTDMYIYPNTIELVKLNGEQLFSYLEHAAQNFNQIDVNKTEPQHLINYEMRAFNYDVVEGIEYVFDVTKPVGERVVEVLYKGKPINPNMEFIIIMNNYRASGGGNYPFMDGTNIVLSTTDVNREIIIDYIEENKIINPKPTNNWRIKPVKTAGQVLYRSSADGWKYLNQSNIETIKYISTNEEGWGIYEIDL